MKLNKLAPIFLILIIFAALAGIINFYVINHHYNDDSKPFSANAMLFELWRGSKLNLIEATSGRTLDRQTNVITTSEGESYTMLRAVWQDDKQTFDKSFKWLTDNLGRQEDHLYSWKFGQRSNGTYGQITEVGGHNTATDADTDIALALAFAYAKWRQPDYYYKSKDIIKDIWAHEVINIQDKPVLVSNNLEIKTKTSVLVNPSYFAPYAYKIFSRIDKEDPWNLLVDNSYDILAQSLKLKLDRQGSANIPPDWIAINTTTGAITPTHIDNLKSDYSFDAIRVPFRLSLDYFWFNEPRAKDILGQMQFLSHQWITNKESYYSYTHDGINLTNSDSPAVYGAQLGYFMIIDPTNAEQIYNTKLLSLYSSDTQNWVKYLPYYDDNYAWFGIALYNKNLPNLTSGINFPYEK